MWIQSRTFILFIVALCVLAVAHKIAILFFLYWTYPWLDIPMHALGGMVVALGFLMVFNEYTHGMFRRGLLITVSVAFMVGLLWELFELANGITVLTDAGYALDTGHDLVMDIVGGFLGYILARTSMKV
jgi:mannose/fructose/N-acetylgalactosamine-specific phosphotransferase system component IIC